jgi:hypothetical protein
MKQSAAGAHAGWAGALFCAFFRWEAGKNLL